MKMKIGMVAVALALAGCGDSSQQAGQQSKANEVHAWPPAPTASVVLAANLLATNYLVLLDNSGSMEDEECTNDESKFDAAKKALKRFAKSISPSDNLALAVFDGYAGVTVVPFGSGDAQRKLFIATLDEVNTDQSTPLSGSTRYAYQEMTLQAQRQLGYGTYRLVIVTDGESTDGNPGPLAKEIVEHSAIEVHAIGFCVSESHSLNVPGYSRFYTANDPAALAKGLQEVQAETSAFDATTFSGK